MRVLLTSHLFPSKRRPTGAPWLAEQVCALRAAGVEIDVLCCSPHEADHDAVDGNGGCEIRAAYRSTSAGPLDGTRAGLLANALRCERRVASHLAGLERRPDLIHAHFAFPDGWAAARVGARAGIPVVLTVHGSDVARILARDGWFAARVGRALRTVDTIIAVSEELAADVRVHLPRMHTVVIPNGYNDTLFRPTDSERDLGFLFVGALLPVKNIEFLVETFLSAAALHTLPLTIVGDGPLRPRIERMIAGAPAGARVTLTGPVERDRVATVMQRATALVVPSRREGFGVVAAEALACGTPVIGSRVGGLPEILADEAAGVLIEPGDRAGLIDAMRSVMTWPHDVDAVRAASGARTWDERAAEIRALYDDVLARDRAGAQDAAP
jgi:glycosyltransferase involved in cell wall biosynthesis